ncbi:MAG: sugar ABC transporter ATP-binding protein [Rhodoferax sp.]
MLPFNNEAATPEPVLAVRGASKRFGPVQALSGVGLRLFGGEIHALMGQNGAGKSTLIKVLTGVYTPDQGHIALCGQAVLPQSVQHAQQLGISTVYQEVNLCPNLSVAENIFAGRYPRHPWGLIAWARMRRDSVELLARLNLDIDVQQPLSRYSVAVQQMVAIARALAVSAKVLVLDEPTSSLDDEEVQRLYAVMRQLRDQGMAILFVTHFLDQVYAVSDRITVLRNGELVGEYVASELGHKALITAMVGRELALDTGAAHKDAHRTAQETGQAPVLLQARSLAKHGVLRPSDLRVHRGEVLGLGGLLGSGRTELARLLFGSETPDQGVVEVDGIAVSIHDPTQAIALGLGFCPEDRKAEGIVGALSVRENIVLALQARQGLWPAVGVAAQRALAQRYVRALGIKTADVDTPIAQLSGGNQQKAVLARWLATQPRLLILDEPTRGIDIAAKQEIMNEILSLAREGMSVLFISSEMDEVVRVSDRIVVLRDRAVVGELPGGSTEQAVYHLIAEHV